MILSSVKMRFKLQSFLWISFCFLSIGTCYGQENDIDTVLKKAKILHNEVYVKQAPGQEFTIKEKKDGFDWGIVCAVVALIVSIIAIIYPILYGIKSERRANFFRMYEYWNADYTIKMCNEVGRVFEQHATLNNRIPLNELRKCCKDDYNIIESVFDVLVDISIGYRDHLIDRKLVASLMKHFIRSYGTLAEKHFVYEPIVDAIRIKMKQEYYMPLIDLKNVLCLGEEEIPAISRENNAP